MKSVRFIACLLFLLPIKIVWGQYNLCGNVTVDKEHEEGVLVQVLNTDIKAFSDNQGNFCLENIKKGTYHLVANYFGFKSDTLKIHITENLTDFQIKINTPYQSFEGIDVVSEKLTDVKASQSIKAEVIDLEYFQRSSVSVEQLMNSTSGIKVRSEGALGDDANIIVGGFHGKSVRFLVDGIPMDYLGSSMSVTKIPTNMAHHIEVYKGVLPTEIGVDALGAAVNIVTQQPNQTKHKFSYEIASYNTHRLSVNSFIRHSEKFSYGINLFANYAANNFKVDDLPLEDPETGKTQYITAKLFNNGYQQISGDVYVNFERRKWADLFRITLNSYGLKRELQNDMTSRARPFGDAQRKENAFVIPSFQYRKNFLDNKLSLNQFLVYSHIRYALTDSLKDGYYDWLGNHHWAISGSEMGTDLSYLKEPVIRTQVDNVTYRGLITYRFNENHKIVFNLIENFLYRIADNLGAYDSKTNIAYNRIIAGFGYHYTFFDKKLEGITQLKYLGSQTFGEIKDMLYAGEGEIQTGRGVSYNNGMSIAQSLKYQPNENWMFRASVENTYRLPDQFEIFGDNVFIKPNLALNPEKSFNVNASVAYNLSKWFKVEVSSYYRNTKDMIRLKDLTQFSAQYLNLEKVNGYGIELEAAVYPVKGLEISGNLTYNEFRYRGSNNQFEHNTHFIGARVSNMPFYFGNARISYNFDRLFTKKDRLSLYYSYNYMHQYYLDFIEKQFEPDGFLGLFGESKVFTDRVIPIQHVHNAGLVWWINLPNERVLSVGAEIRNMFNAKIFNNFRMQSMGRSFSLKISFEI